MRSNVRNSSARCSGSSCSRTRATSQQDELREPVQGRKLCRLATPAQNFPHKISSIAQFLAMNAFTVSLASAIDLRHLAVKSKNAFTSSFDSRENFVLHPPPRVPTLANQDRILRLEGLGLYPQFPDPNPTNAVLQQIHRHQTRLW